MAAKQEIHDFAMRWFEKYRSEKITKQKVLEGFVDECFSLGFEMDCGMLIFSYRTKNGLVNSTCFPERIKR